MHNTYFSPLSFLDIRSPRPLQCTILVGFTLYTAIAATVYLFTNITSMFLSNAWFAHLNLWVSVLAMHLALSALNVFATVWVFTEGGRYYPDGNSTSEECPTSLVATIQEYLYAWYVYFGLFVFFAVAWAFASHTTSEAAAASAKLDAEKQPLTGEATAIL